MALYGQCSKAHSDAKPFSIAFALDPDGKMRAIENYRYAKPRKTLLGNIVDIEVSSHRSQKYGF